MSADPWNGHRGKAYDVGPYMKAHPSGSWLLRLALKRDCTALFVSYVRATSLRPDEAAEIEKMAWPNCWLVLDIDDWQMNTRYQGGYSANSTKEGWF